jgi:hypothetical protein
VSECNDTYVALGGGPPVRADMVDICGCWWCCAKEVWGGGSSALSLPRNFDVLEVLDSHFTSRQRQLQTLNNIIK